MEAATLTVATGTATDTAVQLAAGTMGLFAWILVLGLYFTPTITAFARHAEKRWGVFFLNLLTGWTGAGWIGAMIWAVAGIKDCGCDKEFCDID